MDYREGIMEIVDSIKQESALEFFYFIIFVMSNNESAMRVIDEYAVEGSFEI